MSKEVSHYNESFASYLMSRKFPNNDLEVSISGREGYSEGFLWRHRPFNLEFDNGFLEISSPNRKHTMDFYLKMDFPDDRRLARMLESSIGFGNKESPTRISKFLRKVTRSYIKGRSSTRVVLRIDSEIGAVPKQEEHLYDEIWDKLIKKHYIPASS